MSQIRYGLSALLLSLVTLSPAVWAQAKADGEAGGASGGKPAVFTSHDYRRQMLEFNRRTLSGEYKQVGVRGAWDDAAVAFLDKVAVYFTYGNAAMPYRTVPVPPQGEMVAEGKAVIAAGCGDPLVKYCLAVMLDDSGDDAAATALMKELMPTLDESGYPDYRVAAAAKRLRRLAPGPFQGVDDPSLIESRRIHKLPFLPMDDFQRREMLARLWEHFEGLPSREQQVDVIEYLRGQPGGDPWLMDTLHGRVLIEYAWEARGGGWANQVKEEGWKLFGERLEQARELLERAYKLRPHLPEAPTAMITVAMGGGGDVDDPRAWFERAVAAQIDHVPAYETFMYAMLPRWGGSHGDLYAVGLEAAKTERYDTIVPWQLVMAAKRIAQDLGGGGAGPIGGGNTGAGWTMLLARPGVYEQLNEVVARYVTAYKPRGEDAWYRTLQAALAWRANRNAEARALIAALGDDVKPDAFTMVGSQNPPAAIGQAYILGGPDAARVKQAEAAMKAGTEAEDIAALQQFRALATDLAADAPAKPYLDARIKALDSRVRLAAGEWVDLQPAGNLAGWGKMFGGWMITPDGALVGTTARDQRRASLIYEQDLGDRFEIAVRVEECSPGAKPCFVFARGGQWVGEVALDGKAVTLMGHAARDQWFAQPFAVPFEFSLICDGGTLAVTVGEQAWFDKQFAPASGADLRIGVGAQGEGTIRLSGLKVRKLK